ncbi:MAG: DUF2304 domain-containing protein [Candidatus Magasanikbacteria bacterium]|nr:DUF2304 domain-containing protein [Candidatus Magasanikbacteria bacterium]
MLLIQILLVAFFLYAIYKAGARRRAGDLTAPGAVFWLVFWTAGIAVVIFPVPITFYFARRLGVGRGADLVVYAALALLFFLVFNLMVRSERLNREVTKLTRTIALAEALKKKEEDVNL